MINFVSSLIKISRPLNFLISFASIFLAGVICFSGQFPLKEIIMAAFSGAFIGSGGNIINDIFDLEIDKINRPERVLPRGDLSRREALIIYLLLSLTGIILASFVNANAFLIAIFSFIIIFFYSFKLKMIIFVGNFSVAFLTGLALIYGGIAVNNIETAIFPAIFAFFINLIREIVKDMEDVEGDVTNDVVTLPQKYGFATAYKLILSLTLLLICSTMIPYFMKIYRIEYFVAVMIFVNTSLVYFLRSLFHDKSIKNLGSMSNLLKLIMVLGLLAIYLGK